MADALALEDEIGIPNRGNERAELFGSLPQDEPVDTKPTFTNGLLPSLPPPYRDPACAQQTMCQTAANWQHPSVSYSAQSSGYPMMTSQQLFQQYHPPALLPASTDSTHVNGYHNSDLQSHHVVSTRPTWPPYSQSSVDQRPVIFPPAVYQSSAYPPFIARQGPPGGRRTGLDAVQCSPHPPPYFGVMSSSGGSLCQMTGRRTSPAESCAPLLGSECLQ